MACGYASVWAKSDWQVDPRSTVDLDRCGYSVAPTTKSDWLTNEASSVYEWIKALHIIAVISWMAGMLYLPRLFVYHCDAEIGSKQSETFKVMENRLLK